MQPKVENADTPKKVRKSPSGDRAQSPKETNNNEKKENVKPKKVSPLQISPKVRGEPRPLMAELVPKPDSLKVHIFVYIHEFLGKKESTS